MPDSLWKNYVLTEGKLWHFTGPNVKSDSLINRFYLELKATLAIEESWSYDFKKLSTKVAIDTFDGHFKTFTLDRRSSNSSLPLLSSTLLQVKTEESLKVFELHKELHSDEFDLNNNAIHYSIQAIEDTNPKNYLLVGEYYNSSFTKDKKYVLCAISVSDIIHTLPIFDKHTHLYLETNLIREYINVQYNKYKNTLSLEIWEYFDGIWNPQPTGKGIHLIWDGEQFNTVANTR